MKNAIYPLIIFVLCSVSLAGQPHGKITVKADIFDVTSRESVKNVTAYSYRTDDGDKIVIADETIYDGKLKIVVPRDNVTIILKSNGYHDKPIEIRARADENVLYLPFEWEMKRVNVEVNPNRNLPNGNEMRKMAEKLVLEFHDAVSKMLSKSLSDSEKEKIIALLDEKVDSDAIIAVSSLKNKSKNRHMSYPKYLRALNKISKEGREAKVKYEDVSILEKIDPYIKKQQDTGCFVVKCRYKQKFYSKTYGDITIKVTDVIICPNGEEWTASLWHTEVKSTKPLDKN